MTRRALTVAALAGCGILLGTSAHAQQQQQQRQQRQQQAVLSSLPVDDFSLTASVGWSDNIGGLYQDQVSETIAAAGMHVGLVRDNHRVNYDLSGDVSYVKYLEDTFDDEVAGYLALDADAVLVPEVLTLVLQDTFGQTQTTPFAPSTPDTRQNINVAAAGPDLRLEIGDPLVFLASARYIIESYEITPADSTRQQYQAGLYHEFSSRSSVGVLGQHTVADYDDDPLANFERDEFLLRYQLRAARTAMLLEGGQSHMTNDRGLDREIWLYRADLTRQLTTRTLLNVAAGYELSDSGSLFVSTVNALDGTGSTGGSLADLGLGTTQLGGTGVVASTDALAHRYYRAAWRYNAPRTRAYIGYEYRRERYIDGASFNRDLATITTGLERHLTSAHRLGLDVTHSTRESGDTGILLRDLSFRLSGYWRASRRTEVQLTVERGQRNGSSTGGGFSDNRVWLRTTWTPRS
jgi:hypothetical protein